MMKATQKTDQNTNHNCDNTPKERKNKKMNALLAEEFFSPSISVASQFSCRRY